MALLPPGRCDYSEVGTERKGSGVKGPCDIRLDCHDVMEGEEQMGRGIKVNVVADRHDVMGEDSMAPSLESSAPALMLPAFPMGTSCGGQVYSPIATLLALRQVGSDEVSRLATGASRTRCAHLGLRTSRRQWKRQKVVVPSERAAPGSRLSTPRLLVPASLGMEQPRAELGRRTWGRGRFSDA